MTALDTITSAFVWGVAAFAALAGFAIPVLTIGALQQAWKGRQQ